MIDPKFIGYRSAPAQFTVERGRIKVFAKAIGLTDPIHFDANAARARGYDDVVAPPTFLTVIETDRGFGGGASALPAGMALDFTRLLHGGQEYEYFLPICAGDVIETSGAIADIYSKRDGALQFMVMEAEYRNAGGELVALSRTTLIYRALP